MFFDFSPIGVNIQTSHNISVINNAVVHVMPRSVSEMDGFNDPIAAMIICAFNYGDFCMDIVVMGNTVSGADYAGFGAFGHPCGVEDNSFRDNVAHSINGYGAIIYPSVAIPSTSECLEGSHFAAYKNTDMGVISFFDT